MAYLHRLVFAALLLVLACVAHAANLSPYACYQAAFDAATADGKADGVTQNAAYNNCIASGGGNNCGSRNYTYSVVDERANMRVKLTECITGSVNSGSQVTCAYGYYTYTSITCPTNTCTYMSGKSAGWWTYQTGIATESAAGTNVMANRYLCIPREGGALTDGCTVLMDPDVATKDASGQWVSAGNASYTGGSCNPTATGGDGLTLGGPVQSVPTSTTSTTPPPAEKPSCSDGLVSAVVNSVTVCVPPADNIPTVSDSTSNNTKTVAGPEGTTTQAISEQKTTTCDGGGVCKTVVVTTTKQGIATTVTTAETAASKSDYCSSNPASVQCTGTGKGSSFSGNCAGGFKAEGDALQVAIAQEQHKRNCQLYVTATAESDAYADAKLHKDDDAGDATKNLPGNATTAISSASFDTSSAIGSGACITDKTVTVWHSSVTLPFSMVCPQLDTLRGILLSVSFLVALAIVFRSPA